MNMSLKQLIDLDNNTLFDLAQKKTAHEMQKFWSPNIINAGCTTTPPCNHCKWECFKSEKQMATQKTPLNQFLKMAEMEIAQGCARMLLPSGWVGYSLPDYYFDYVNAVKSNFDIEVFGLFGSINKNSLLSLKQAGMDGYQCGLESVNEKIYRQFRPGGDSLNDRIKTLTWAKELGLKLWSGFVLGFGLEQDDIIKSIELLISLDVSCVGIQPFVPFPYTQFSYMDPANPSEWARIIAVASLYMTDSEFISTENQSPYGNFSKLAGVKWHPIFPNNLQNVGPKKIERSRLDAVS